MKRDPLARTNRWSKDEDYLLMDLIESGKTVTQAAEYLPGRSPKACGARHWRLVEEGIAKAIDPTVAKEHRSRSFHEINRRRRLHVCTGGCGLRGEISPTPDCPYCEPYRERSPK